MEFLATVLFPIIAAMRYLLDAFHSLFGSWGLSIVALSVSVSFLVLPLQRFGRRVESKIEKLTSSVNAEVAMLDSSLKGEKRFEKIEKIYQSHGYHPIHQVLSGASILVILPVLISAVVLFNNHPQIVGSEFLFISDLSMPDGLLWNLNLLPGLMFLVTMFDAFSRFHDNKTGLYKFLLLSIVLAVLVYNLPSALLIFWIFNNLLSMVLFRFGTLFTFSNSHSKDRIPQAE